MEHELFLVFLQELCGARFIQEEGIDAFDVLYTYFRTLEGVETNYMPTYLSHQ